MLSRHCRPLALACLVALAFPACGVCGSGAPGIDGESRALVDLAAADALVTIVVRPERWPTLRDALVAHVPERLRTPLANLASPWDAPVLLSRGALSIGALVHLDKQRPMAIGLFVQPGGLLDAAAAVAADDGTHGRQMRLILPATDAAALARELRDEAKRMNWATLDDEAIESSFVAIFVEGDHVRLEVVTGAYAHGTRGDHGGLVDSVARKRKPSDAWRETWRQRLAARPRTELPTTAGLAHALAPDAAVSAYVQTLRLREAAGALGGSAVVEALAFVDDEMREMLRAVGIGEILTAWSLVAPERAWVGDLGARVVVRDGLAVELVASLTDKGADAYRAATDGAGPIPRPASGGFFGASLGLSLGVLADRVEVPPSWSDARPEELARAFMACGMVCSLSLEATLAAFEVMLDASGVGSRATLPHAVGLAVDRAIGGDPRPALTLALGYRDAPPTAAVEGLWRKVARDGHVRTEAVAGGTFLVLDDGRAPATSFAVGDGPLASLVLDLDRARAVLGDEVPPLSGRLAAQTTLAGHALAVSVCLGPEATPERCAPPPVDSALPPVATPAASEASVCLDKAVRTLAEGWRDATDVAPEERALVVARARAAAAIHLACAERDALHGASAKTLRALDARLAPASK